MRLDAGFSFGCVYPLVLLHETIGKAARRRWCRSGVSDRSRGGTSAQTRSTRAAGHLVNGLEGHHGLGSSCSMISRLVDLSCSISRRAHLYMKPSDGSSEGSRCGRLRDDSRGVISGRRRRVHLPHESNCFFSVAVVEAVISNEK
jgi:hypothetical protein